MHERVGVCGSIGSGKSHVCRLMETRFGYKHVNSDQVFKNYLNSNIKYRKILEEYMKDHGVQPFIAQQYQSLAVADFLFGRTAIEDNFKNLREFNVFNAPYVMEAIAPHVYVEGRVVLEMAILPAFAHYEDLMLDETICVVNEVAYQNAISRDTTRAKELTSRICLYAIDRLKDLLVKYPDIIT